ncbi:hypothetical protein [Clostridium butyricum]|uniref:hypothetical protein n=1 Tax=Clostridium butyricum TaxID=1492 RepID=UPI00374E5D5A
MFTRYFEDEKEELSESIIYGDKKFIGVNDLDLVDDIEFDVYKYRRLPRPTHFEEGKGIIGILTKDGIFVECEYGGHNSTINFIDNGHQNLNGAAVFGTGCETGLGGNVDSYVRMDTTWSKLSKYQIRWYKENKKYLDERQIRTMDRYLKKKVY